MSEDCSRCAVVELMACQKFARKCAGVELGAYQTFATNVLVAKCCTNDMPEVCYKCAGVVLMACQKFATSVMVGR